MNPIIPPTLVLKELVCLIVLLCPGVGDCGLLLPVQVTGVGFGVVSTVRLGWDNLSQRRTLLLTAPFQSDIHRTVNILCRPGQISAVAAAPCV